MEEHGIPEPKTPGPWGMARVDLLRKARAKLEIIKEEQVPIFASGMGSPAFILDELHEAGVKVWGLIGLARQARRELEQGLDLIVAQGQDSAGHTGRIGTFSIVPEVVEIAREHDTPILAAGGVTTGRHIVAAIALGAVGVWTGTMWQATHESETEMFLKQRLIEARAEDPYQSRAMSGKPIRQLPSRYGDAWKQPGAPEPLQMPLQGMLVGGLLQGIRESKMEDWMTTPAGQSVVGIHEIKPAAEVVFDMVEEAQELLEQTAGEPAGA